MREIKFRVWDKELNQMLHTTNLEWYDDSFGFRLEKHTEDIEYKLMQYIGISDIKRVEIYEGDIVELNIIYWDSSNKEYIESETKIVGEIIDFKGLGWSIRYKDKDNNIDYPLQWLLGKDDISYTIEVKGNIFENKGLSSSM